MTAKRDLLKILAIILIPVIIWGWILVRLSEWVVKKFDREDWGRFGV